MHDVITQKILEKNSANNSKYLEEAVTKFICRSQDLILQTL